MKEMLHLRRHWLESDRMNVYHKRMENIGPQLVSHDPYTGVTNQISCESDTCVMIYNSSKITDVK